MTADLISLLWVFVGVSLVSVALRIIHLFRARAMRALAARWGFQYIGPPVPNWWNPAHPKISPPLPAWFPLACRPSGLRQVWNVIEGQQNGVSVLIFDSIVGSKGGHGYTVIACQTEQNPFGRVTSSDRVIQSHGWTVVHGVWFLFFSWTMGTKRVDKYMNGLRFGSVCERNC